MEGYSLHIMIHMLNDTHVEYIRGTESRVSDVDINILAIFYMLKYAKNLGITNVA